MLASRSLDLHCAAKVLDLKVSNRKVSDHSNLKILTSKQMLQKLEITFAQLKAVNTPENLLNEIRKIIYPLHWEK